MSEWDYLTDGCSKWDPNKQIELPCDPPHIDEAEFNKIPDAGHVGVFPYTIYNGKTEFFIEYHIPGNHSMVMNKSDKLEDPTRNPYPIAEEGYAVIIQGDGTILSDMLTVKTFETVEEAELFGKQLEQNPNLELVRAKLFDYSNFDTIPYSPEQLIPSEYYYLLYPEFKKKYFGKDKYPELDVYELIELLNLRDELQ